MVTIIGTAIDDIGGIETIRAMGLRFLATKPFGPAAPADPTKLDAAILICLQSGVILRSTTEDGLATGMFCAYTMEHPFTGERMAEELAWWVEPEYRAGKVGIYLLRSAIEWARQIGVSCLRMNAPYGTRVGIILERHGFTPVETAHVLRF